MARKTGQTIIVNARFLTQPLTGVQRFAIEVSRHLKKIRPEWKWVCPEGILHKDVAKELEAEVIGPFKGHIWEQLTLARLVKKRNGKLLNLGNTAPYFTNPHITVVHDLAFERFPESYNRNFVRFYKWLVPRVCKKSEFVLTVSEFSRNEIHSLYRIPKEKIVVVYNGVSDSLKTAVEEPVEKLIDRKFLLVVSSLNKRKNLEVLMDLPINEHIPRLVIVGTGHSVFANIKAQSQKATVLEDVRAGQLAWLYKNARMVVYPSVYEGFGLPILEALWFGADVLVNDIPVFRELFEGYVRFGDFSSPKSALKSITEYPYDKDEKSSSRGKDYIFESFDFTKIAEKIARIT